MLHISNKKKRGAAVTYRTIMMMIPHGTFSRRQRLAAVAAPVWSVKRLLDLLIPTYTQTNSSREKKKKKNRLPFCTLVFMCRYRTFHGGLHAKKKAT